MAEDDEIDILGDFSFNSCLAQNNQGIPSCSDREDTVHPQWLFDSVSTNWYDTQNKDNSRSTEGSSRKLTGNNSEKKYRRETQTLWSQNEREILMREMAKYGRNIHKISQTLKSKTEAEIQALIEAEFGVNLDTPVFGLEKNEELEDTPIAVQEEIVTDDVTSVLNLISTGMPTVPVLKKPFRKKTYKVRSKNSLLRPDALHSKEDNFSKLNQSEIFYDDDMIIGLTESIGSEADSADILARKLAKQHKEKVKAMKKIGNHRRKDKGHSSTSKDLSKSPVGRQRKDSSLSDDNAKSPKMQIVFSSGQALPVSEGEQIIKIEKKKDSESESDIEIDIDSDNESENKVKTTMIKLVKEEQTAKEVPARKLQPVRKRHTKINLSGDGGYTIMHTATGDVYEIGAEPKKERAPKKVPIHLIQCRVYNSEKPAPFSVEMQVSCLLSMDVHAHTSRAEVMGLVGGRYDCGVLGLICYKPVKAAAGGTHCDMDPVSQACACERVSQSGCSVAAWHHSHPLFTSAPSRTDLVSQLALQHAERETPLVALITSQHWPQGRTASQYRCFRVEDTEEDGTPIGYQFSLRLKPDLTTDNLCSFLDELRIVVHGNEPTEYSVNMTRDVCPQAKITYSEKCISSMRHLMHSAGYESDNPIVEQLILGVRDVFR